MDQIVPEEYDICRAELMNVLMFEEKQRLVSTVSTTPRLLNVMRRTWEIGTFWYILALSSPTGLFTIFYKHIQPRFSKDSEELSDAMPFY